MTQSDLRLISKLVQNYRDETSCVTTGEHRGITTSGIDPTPTPEDLVAILDGLAAFCAVRGWDFASLVQRQATNG